MVHHSDKTSVALRHLIDSLPKDEKIVLNEILQKLDARAFGLLLFALAAPNCIPNIPGISTIFGVLIIAPALQMIFGVSRVWLPKKISQMEIQPTHLSAGLDKAIPILEKLEKFIRPRLEFLTEKPITSILGIEVLILAGILIFPIPFANIIPGIAIALIALGMLQRDGALIIIANILFILSLALAFLGVGAGLAAIHWTITTIYEFFGQLFN